MFQVITLNFALYIIKTENKILATFYNYIYIVLFFLLN